MALNTSLPTLYEHYVNGPIVSGLSAQNTYFTLNEKPINIYSGAMHYFRIPRPYWRDRLRRLRAAGLNTVETYVPWNLHEPQDGVFDFGNGDFEMSDFLHLEEFLKTAQEEDLFAIVRQGPYICAEWEFGGFPSWLLRYKGIELRTSQQTYMQFVTRYFNMLLPILAALQFTRGGPVIAFQVENEYGSTESKTFTPDKLYLTQLRELFLKNNITELLVTSDSPSQHQDHGTIPSFFLQTANFDGNPEMEFKKLLELQPGKPVMAMEFWSGWFDHWSELHHTRRNSEFKDVYERILKFPASVSMYMFHGGTNFGFLNGGNYNDKSTDNKGYQPTTTSYDYDAPLTEAGDYTEKYVMVKELIKKYTNVELKTPETPHVNLRKAYPKIQVTDQLTLNEIINKIPEKTISTDLIPMEYLPINNNSGQSYGYILYRKEGVQIKKGDILEISGRICDSVMVIQDGVLISKPLNSSNDLNGFGYWRQQNSKISLNASPQEGSRLDLLVENWGRVNFGYLDQYIQLKGLWQGPVSLNGNSITNWEIVPLEFKSKWNKALSNWHPARFDKTIPALYRAVFDIEEEPQDTYLNMSEWSKGIVIVNGFVLGRYALIGPQQTLYLPAPFLKSGANEILIFEHFVPSPEVAFSKNPFFKTL